MFGSADLMDQGITLPLLIIATLKGTIMLAAAGVAGRMLKNSSAAVRHVLWCTALFSLLVFFAGVGGFERWRVPILPAALVPAGVAAGQVMASTAGLSSESTTTLAASSELSRENIPSKPALSENAGVSWQSVILIVWLLGVLLVLTRLIAGTIRVRRLVRKATPLTHSSWPALIDELSRQLKFGRPVRVLRSHQSVIPMTCGVFSAVVLLPNEVERWSADRRRVVLLHELIHVKRKDLLTQTLAQIVCALYWFNPLVWLAVGELRKEQEWACDERVLATGIKASDYAGHLLEIGRAFATSAWPPVATTAIVRRSQLEQRLRAILKPALRRPASARLKAVSVSVLSVLFVLLAGTQLVSSEKAVGNSLSLSVASESQQQQSSTRKQDQKAAPKQSPESNQSPRPTPSPSPAASPAANETGDDQMAEQVFNSFSAEERNRLMNNGIGPAYIREMAGAGYRKLTAAQLIALFSNTVRADYVASLGSVGYPDLPPAELIALRTNGITADVIKSFQAVKYADFQAGNYIAFRSNGVTPSYLKSMSAAGYDKLTPKQIVDMWVAGVTADFIRDARRRGQTNLSPEELIEQKKREKP